MAWKEVLVNTMSVFRRNREVFANLPQSHRRIGGRNFNTIHMAGYKAHIQTDKQAPDRLTMTICLKPNAPLWVIAGLIDKAKEVRFQDGRKTQVMISQILKSLFLSNPWRLSLLTL